MFEGILNEDFEYEESIFESWIPRVMYLDKVLFHVSKSNSKIILKEKPLENRNMKCIGGIFTYFRATQIQVLSTKLPMREGCETLMIKTTY